MPEPPAPLPASTADISMLLACLAHGDHRASARKLGKGACGAPAAQAVCSGLPRIQTYLGVDLGATDTDASGLSKDVIHTPRGRARPPEPASLFLLGRDAREWQGCPRYCAMATIALFRSGVCSSHSASSGLEPFDDTGAWLLHPLSYNRDPECLASICRWLPGLRVYALL